MVFGRNLTTFAFNLKVPLNKKRVIQHIVNWLNNYCDSALMNGFAVGISGGIDSALTSTLCALTGKQVICLNMPIHQHKAEYERGKEHIAWLKKKFKNASSHETDLTNVFETFKKTIPEDILDPLSLANTRSRIRMITLYAFAGNKKLLVAGTGNKVEDFGVGFFTKYGDGGVDLSPIADLVKSEVYGLAKELGVVESILKAKPTDGLWHEERTDEDQIGATYDELEWAMQHLEKKQVSKNLSERQRSVLHIYEHFNKGNGHKMLPIPVCVIPGDLKK